MYADAEQFLLGFLEDQRPDVRGCTELPATLTAALPLWQVDRIGGSDVEPGIDQATLDLEAFAASRPAAKILAEDARELIRFKLPGYSNQFGTALRVETISGPSWRPYDNTNVRRVGATYRITIHATT